MGYTNREWLAWCLIMLDVDFLISPDEFDQIVKYLDDKTLSQKTAVEVVKSLFGGGTIDEIIDAKGLRQLTVAFDVTESVEKVLYKYKVEWEVVEKAKSRLMAKCIGEVMQLSKGKANPNSVREKLEEKLTAG